MVKKRLMTGFYEMKAEQLMDKRVWDLPLLSRDEDIHNVLNILGARNHIWIVNNQKDKELIGIITEHDVLSILAPKKFPSYVFGMTDVRSIHHGTAQIAGDIMCSHLIICHKEDKIIDVLEKMTAHRLRRLPVIEDKKIIGEITLHQLIRKYYDATQYTPITDDEEG
jgi:predicted transcriptional regulator